VEFFKDVGGIYSKDPKVEKSAIKFSLLDYPEALNLIKKGAKILHARAVKLAEKNFLPLHVLSFKSFNEEGTVIASVDDPCTQEVVREFKDRGETYSLNGEADWRARNIEVRDGTQIPSGQYALENRTPSLANRSRCGVLTNGWPAHPITPA